MKHGELYWKHTSIWDCWNPVVGWISRHNGHWIQASTVKWLQVEGPKFPFSATDLSNVQTTLRRSKRSKMLASGCHASDRGGGGIATTTTLKTCHVCMTHFAGPEVGRVCQLSVNMRVRCITRKDLPQNFLQPDPNGVPWTGQEQVRRCD